LHSIETFASQQCQVYVMDVQNKIEENKITTKNNKNNGNRNLTEMLLTAIKWK